MVEEIGINVTAIIDEALGALESLIGSMGGIPDQVSTDIVLNGIEEANISMEQLGEAAANAGVDITGMSEGAVSLESINTSASQATDGLKQLGDSGKEAGEGIATSFTEAALAIATITAGSALAEGVVQDANLSFEKLGRSYEGGESGLREDMAAVTDAKFPLSEALDYVKLLKQAGVESSHWADSADDLNKIQIATGATDETMIGLVRTMKMMGDDLTNLEDDYNAFAYVNANVIGGMDTFNTYMQRFGFRFKEMGLNMDQAAVIVKAASDKFGTSRQGVMAFSKALNESHGNIDILAQKLGISSDAIRNASSITAEYTGVIDKNADAAERHSTATEKISAVLDDLNARFGEGLGNILQWATYLGIAVTAVLALDKVIRVLNANMIGSGAMIGKFVAALPAIGMAIGAVQGMSEKDATPATVLPHIQSMTTMGMVGSPEQYKQANEIVEQSAVSSRNQMVYTTIDILNRFGARIDKTGYGIKVLGDIGTAAAKPIAHMGKESANTVSALIKQTLQSGKLAQAEANLQLATENLNTAMASLAIAMNNFNTDLASTGVKTEGYKSNQMEVMKDYREFKDKQREAEKELYNKYLAGRGTPGGMTYAQYLEQKDVLARQNRDAEARYRSYMANVGGGTAGMLRGLGGAPLQSNTSAVAENTAALAANTAATKEECKRAANKTTVHFYGDMKVRKESDIHKIANQITDATLNSATNGGVSIVNMKR
jgi:hypothetical protein